MRYATKECADCHILLPAPQMIQRAGRKVTGSSRSLSRQMGANQNLPRETITTHSRQYSYYLCRPCDEQRRKELRRLVVIVLLVSVAVLPVVAVLALSNKTATAVADVSVATEPPLNEIAELPLDGEEAAAGPVLQVSGNYEGANAKDQASPQMSAASDEVPSSKGQLVITGLMPDILAAVDQDIVAALAAGQPRRWAWHGMKGHVVVSATTLTSAGACRSFYITVDVGPDRTESAPQTRCAASGWN